jgi:hypothetical protein
VINLQAFEIVTGIQEVSLPTAALRKEYPVIFGDPLDWCPGFRFRDISLLCGCHSVGNTALVASSTTTLVGDPLEWYPGIILVHQAMA